MDRQIEGFDAAGNAVPTDAMCPALSPCGKCAIYAARPMICRIWGLVKEMVCPHGCQPARWLSGRETTQYLALAADGQVEGPGRDFIAAMQADPGLRDRVHEHLGNPFGPKDDRRFRD